MTKVVEKQGALSLLSVLRAMAGRRVVVIGDMMLDRFVYGDVNRISPEGPIPVLAIKREVMMLGGAGNVLANLRGLGAAVDVIALVGQDPEADTIRKLLRDLGSTPDFLIQADDRPTTIKTRFIASGQHVLRVDYERTHPVVEGLEHKVIAAIEGRIPGADMVIVSDYGKGILTKAVIQSIIKCANRAGVRVLVDPKAKDYGLYKGADIATPNRKELAEATGLNVDGDDAIIHAAETLIKTSGIKSIVATRSEDGMTIVQPGVTTHLKTQAQEVFDVAGAGDTVIATLAAALSAGADLVDAARIANIAAGIVVGKVGTAAIRRDELMAVLEQADQIQMMHQAPLLDLRAAVEQVERWKASGLKVGFSNGCFDVLHAGHVTYLQQARSRCDRLIVAINADESVRRLKGPTRPVNDEQSRAAVLGALGCVDMVVLFGADAEEQDTPVKVLKALTPDILVKGGDYTTEGVVGGDYVISMGGEVWVAPLVPGKSTTSTIEKMKAKG